MKSAFHDIYTTAHRCILEAIQALPRRDRPSAKAIRVLAQCISLVSLGLESACLVDFCRIPAPQDTLPKLIANLRKNCTACAPIFALVDPTTEDTFFVNFWLFAGKLGGSGYEESGLLSLELCPATLLQNVTFVLLDEPVRELDALTEPLWSLLLFLHSNLLSEKTLGTRIASLPELVLLSDVGLGPHVLVPLAGILLDYPVAYVPKSCAPSQDTESYLSGHALDVFDLGLRSQTGELLELIKFSCPAEFSVHNSSGTRNLNSMRKRLGLAIHHLNSNVDEGEGPRWELVFGSSRVVMDRVAL